MRSLLVAFLFIIVVIAIYMQTVGGEDGMENKVTGHGQKISQTIQSISP